MIAIELISVILSCLFIYRIWCHNLEMQYFGEVYSAALAKPCDFTDKEAGTIIKTYMEAVGEEVYEYVWTTDKIEYRTGADMSYKSAGTLEKDKMINCKVLKLIEPIKSVSARSSAVVGHL